MNPPQSFLSVVFRSVPISQYRCDLLDPCLFGTVAPEGLYGSSQGR